MRSTTLKSKPKQVTIDETVTASGLDIESALLNLMHALECRANQVRIELMKIRGERP